jgi:anti-anti-sigma factor
MNLPRMFSEKLGTHPLHSFNREGRPAMNVAMRKVGSVVILDLGGRLTIEADTPTFQQAVAALAKLAAHYIVLNMERVRSMDCWGIGQIAVCYRTIRHKGGTLKLLKLDRRSRHLMEMAKILTVIEAYDSEEEVVRSFGDAAREGSRRQKSPTAHSMPDRYWPSWLAERRP